jgi:hypothetical protein
VPDDTLNVPGIDPNTTTAARLYSLLINPDEGQFLPIDVTVCNALRSACPEIGEVAQDNRVFVRRATRYMVNQGIKQIIDVGSGLPADENTHEVAHKLDPSVRVVYDDKDPMTVSHGEHLLKGSKNVAFLGYDAREPEKILGDPKTRELINFDEPVGFMMASIMQLFGEETDTHDVVRRFLEPAAPGSYLAFSHFVVPGKNPPVDGPPQDRVDALLAVMAGAGEPLIFRTREDIERYFEGLELMQPYEGSEKNDLVWVNRWGAKDPARAFSSGVWLLAGVGRKP